MPTAQNADLLQQLSDSLRAPNTEPAADKAADEAPASEQEPEPQVVTATAASDEGPTDAPPSKTRKPAAKPVAAKESQTDPV